MAVYNVHGGHSLICRGASGLLDEVNEDRAVKNKVIAYLRAAGHTVYDCTDDNGRTQGANLSAIVAKCNAHKVDLDVSIHLNAGGGTGCEVENYDSGTKAVSDRICANISAALGIRNRGTKYMKDLYVLRNTKSPAILVECCFVDNATDQAAWNVDKCAKAIAEGIMGTAVSGGDTAAKPVESPKPAASTPKQSNKNHVDFTYAVRAGGKTYPPVTNLADYAGVRGIPITDIAIKCSVGNIKYRVHVAANKKKGIAGRWLPYVSGYNWKDSNNGYAGNGLPIDAIEIIYTAPNGSTQKAQYRVSPVNRNYYSWQYNNETGGGQDGYAGAFGVLIDRFQLF